MTAKFSKNCACRKCCLQEICSCDSKFFRVGIYIVSIIYTCICNLLLCMLVSPLTMELPVIQDEICAAVFFFFKQNTQMMMATHNASVRISFMVASDVRCAGAGPVGSACQMNLGSWFSAGLLLQKY